MEIDASCANQRFHAPVELIRLQLLCGFLQIELLPFQPRGGGKSAVLRQSLCHLGGGAGGLFHHSGFQFFEVGAAHMPGKSGDGRVREFQTLGKLPDG